MEGKKEPFTMSLFPIAALLQILKVFVLHLALNAWNLVTVIFLKIRFYEILHAQSLRQSNDVEFPVGKTIMIHLLRNTIRILPVSCMLLLLLHA